MKPKLIIKVLTVDKPTLTGKIYPRALVKSACEKINQRTSPCLGTIGAPKGASIILDEASHIATDFQVVGDDLMCSVRILNTSCGRTLERLMKSHTVEFKPWGIGFLDVGGVVSGDYELLGVYAQVH